MKIIVVAYSAIVKTHSDAVAATGTALFPHLGGRAVGQVAYVGVDATLEQQRPAEDVLFEAHSAKLTPVSRVQQG